MPFVFTALAAVSMPAMASDHGGGAPEPMVFTVNMGSGYLQFGLTFDGTAEALQRIAAFKPRLQHRIILLLSSQEQSRLRTLEGKKSLVADIVDTANRVIGEDTKTGIADALFTKFLIQ